MSRTFSTNSGSVDSLKVLARCGWTPNSRKSRYTVLFEIPVASAAPRTVRACPRRASSAAPSPAGSPRLHHHARAAGPAAARHRAPPDLARGTACASARPPGSTARPHARSRCLERPPPSQHDARSAHQALRCAPRPHQIAQARSLGPGRSISCLRGRPMLLLPLPNSACLRAAILHVISGTLHYGGTRNPGGVAPGGCRASCRPGGRPRTRPGRTPGRSATLPRTRRV